MPVKLQQLVYFVRVAEEGQMTRAARSLHLAQPALSQAIAHLESQLGVELLERHARGVSLTAAGEAFFAKARVALSAAADAELTAQSLTRAAKSVIELGFLGSPPMLDAPELFAAFAYLHPELEVSFRELPFPCDPTTTWLEEVDVALCFSPTPHPDVRIQPLRVEPRVVVTAKSHPLARRGELTVEEVLDETFPGIHPSVDPVWAGFWQLDDHRGSPAPHVTSDHAINPHELAAIIASGRAITAMPASSAANVVRALTNVVAIPLPGADPATLALVWNRENPNALVAAIVAAAANIATTGPAVEPPEDA
ncbi:MAG TPA: LysR family transcriptional regulator [Solirubrobacteraceae bacterium]|nr:LysR family transcriptional regulator [Solirubrobacteraceae bacterium]